MKPSRWQISLVLGMLQNISGTCINTWRYMSQFCTTTAYINFTTIFDCTLSLHI
jgi:hypothetical protein